LIYTKCVSSYTMTVHQQSMKVRMWETAMVSYFVMLYLLE